MRDSWHNKHRFIMSMKSREPVSEVKLYRNINGEVYSQMNRKEIRENIIPINTGEELISIKDVVSAKITENQ